MIGFVLYFALVAGAAVLCDRVKGLRANSLAVGLVFGVLGIVSHLLPLACPGWTCVIRDAPLIAAAFYFGPVAGVVAGLSAMGLAYLFPAISTLPTLLCPISTLITALYAAALARWVFEAQRPAPVPAMIAAAFGEVIHLAFDSFSGGDALAMIVEIVHLDFLPEIICYAAAVLVVAAACRSLGSVRENFASSLTIAMVVFAIGFLGFASVQMMTASRQTDSAVREAKERMDHDVDDQLGFVLHCNAISLVNYIRSIQPRTIDQMRDLSAIYDVDEIWFVDRNGMGVASTDPLMEKYPAVFRQSEELHEFLTLTNGVRKFVKQRFRRSKTDTSIVSKYIGVPFPDGSGLVQVGYYWSRFERNFEKFFFPMMVDMAIGESGYYLVANEKDRRIANDAHGYRGIVGRSLEEVGMRAEDETEDGVIFTSRPFGRLSRCLRLRIGEWCVYAVVPFAEAYGPAMQMVFFGCALLLVVCLIFRLVMLRFKLARQKIDDLRAREEERREKDLALAKTIQHSALPADFPDESDFRLFALMDAAKVVGGDFYDFFFLPSGELCFLVADVSGKGVPGAMFMMRAKMILRGCICGEDDLAVAVANANAQLCEGNEAEMFVTVWAGVYSRNTGDIRYVNAGHNPPLVKRADGEVEWVRTRPCMPLAAMDGMRYRMERMRLESGDSMLLYTDGVTEAINAEGGFYGEARLEATLRKAGSAFVLEARRDVDLFAGGIEQADDITLMALDRK